MPKVNGKDMDAGCYVDGHWGQYGASRVLRIADDLLGTKFFGLASELPENELGTMTSELQFSDSLAWLSEEAEQRLNDATNDGYWEWHDGEFFLSEDGAIDYGDTDPYDE